MPDINIAAKHEPYRRCGMNHTRQGVVHPAGTFTGKQLETLRADPHLVVTDVAPSEDKPAPARKTKTEVATAKDVPAALSAQASAAAVAAGTEAAAPTVPPVPAAKVEKVAPKKAAPRKAAVKKAAK